ncbi:hypothetical protein SH528x_003582 [Novipirellula sp. SH528]|uniref:hypothetical protein n=1 Tax=Novipirellula sp. SH528 TaxID=3454466 RepID=UPI003FA16C8D
MTKSQSASQVTDRDTICHLWRKRSVIVDRATGMVEFTHCHVARRSIVFPTTQPYFACSTSELKAVHFTPRFKNNRAFLTVVTTTGRANVPDTGPQFATLREWFAEAVPSNDPEFATDNPLAVFAYVLVGMVSLFTAAFQAEGAGNAAMLIAALFGAIVGVIGTHLVVHLGGHVFNTDISYGIFAIALGVAISAAIGLFAEWSTALSVGITLTVAFCSVMYCRRRWLNGRIKSSTGAANHAKC